MTGVEEINKWIRSSGLAIAVRRAALRILFGCCFISPALVGAQPSAPPVGLPVRAPGYEHYYHTVEPSTAFAIRWGYFDGYQDGKHDRELGKPPAPTEQDRYKLVPDHGLHPELPRMKYKSLYRTAYLNGYEYGSKL